ncbi:MAG: DUF115 domain-containing protein [Spirochaetes bacterium]|nr:DUF115 domain-containing protein [Spirochaetota bacterium]
MYERNLSRNLPLIRRFGGLSPVISAFENKSVIITGAGPSLDGYYEVLREHSRRQDVLIVAADMAYRQLLKNGIVPDFVITCETVARDFFITDDIETVKIKKPVALLAFSCSSHSNLRKWKGSINFFNWMKKGPGFDELWDTAGRDLGFVGTASIVTTQAISIALGCGIRQLILLGNDLGFSSGYYGRDNDRYYGLFCTGDRFNPALSSEKKLLEKIKHYEIIRGNEKFFTNHQFAAAKQWLDDLFGKTEKPVFDGSIPGCSPDKVKKISVKDFRNILSLKKNRRV